VQVHNNLLGAVVGGARARAQEAVARAAVGVFRAVGVVPPAGIDMSGGCEESSAENEQVFELHWLIGWG
jgi:hypothetical protein